MQRFPNRVSHSKAYRIAELYSNRRVLVIGNSASGHDITTLLVQSGKPKLPVYQSRRSRSRFDGGHPPEGIEWKPVIKEYNSSTGEIIFDDSSVLADIDHVIYCTGYQPSFPFWNSRANGGPLYDYAQGRLRDSYQHTFSRVFPHTLGIIGLPRVLTFRSFEYQAIALARLFAGRSARPLPPLSEQVRWEQERARLTEREGRKFHDILWDTGETMSWLRFLFEFAGLPVLEGAGRCPPVLGAETRWQIENVRKYPIPGDDDDDGTKGIEDGDANEWVVVEPPWAQKE